MQTLLPQMTNSLSVKNTAIFYKAQLSSTKDQLYIDKFLRPGFAFYTDIYGNEVTDIKNVNFNTDAKNSTLLPTLINSEHNDYTLIIRKLMYNRLSAVEKNSLNIIFDNQDILILKKKLN